jgi:TRAP-type C4-dicarboxylate transport system permease small subunit
VARALAAVNRVVVLVSMVALVLAALVLTYSVFSRYFFKAATDWQDELAVFLLVGATFMCGAYVQSYRGHVGIEALAGVLPPSVNHVRMLVVDVLTFAFCAFFAWKSWTLFHEAWVDHQTTSSSWAPPLTIPYGLMATGMTLLALQALLQLLTRLSGAERRK